jgi:hypothetical protein
MGMQAVKELHWGTIISGIGHEPMRHDRLVGSIYRNLPIVVLYKPVASRRDPVITSTHSNK